MHRLFSPEMLLVVLFTLLVSVVAIGAAEPPDATAPAPFRPELRAPGWDDPARVAACEAEWGAPLVSRHDGP